MSFFHVAMCAQFDDDDVGKTVVNANGEEVGIVATVEHGTAEVEPNPGITDTIKAKLGWGERGDDTYPLQEDAVQRVTDSEIRLKGELEESGGATGAHGTDTNTRTGTETGTGAESETEMGSGTGMDSDTETGMRRNEEQIDDSDRTRDDEGLLGDDDDDLLGHDDEGLLDDDDHGTRGGDDTMIRNDEHDDHLGDDDDEELLGDDDDEGLLGDDDDDDLLGDDDDEGLLGDDDDDDHLGDDDDRDDTRI